MLVRDNRNSFLREFLRFPRALVTKSARALDYISRIRSTGFPSRTIRAARSRGRLIKISRELACLHALGSSTYRPSRYTTVWYMDFSLSPSSPSLSLSISVYPSLFLCLSLSIACQRPALSAFLTAIVRGWVRSGSGAPGAS